ncbi:putative chymopapain protein, partial [Tanacetum coccineum]
ADSRVLSLCVEDLDYMGRIKKLNEYLEKVRAMVKPQDVAKAALSAMSSVTDILFVMLEIFKDNLKHIDETNKKLSNYWLGLNEFADLSHEEFKNMFLGLKGELPEKREESSEEFTYRDFVDLPKSLDWRKKGAVGRGRIHTGSCWAFSTVAAVEGINQIVTGNFTELSEQELIDCDTSFNNGCNGGTCDEKKGVFDGHCGTDLDDGVAVVGYGTSKGVDYLTVRNSWGPKWGEIGYIRMREILEDLIARSHEWIHKLGSLATGRKAKLSLGNRASLTDFPT